MLRFNVIGFTEGMGKPQQISLSCNLCLEEILLDFQQLGHFPKSIMSFWLILTESKSHRLHFHLLGHFCVKKMTSLSEVLLLFFRYAEMQK